MDGRRATETIAARNAQRTFNTKREAEQFLARQSADIQRGDYLDPRLSRTTFREWADQWLATTVHLKPKTRVSYESILHARVLPEFGDARIAAIEQVDVRRFVARLAEGGDQPGTIRNTFNVVRLVFGTAAGSGAIRVNPCTGVRMPKSLRTEMLFLSAAEVLQLAGAIGDPFGTLVTFAAYTGLRAGEIGALRVGRVNLQQGSIEVRESLADVKGKLVFGATKTYARPHRSTADVSDLRTRCAPRQPPKPARRPGVPWSYRQTAPTQPLLRSALQARRCASRPTCGPALPRPASHLRGVARCPGRAPEGDHGTSRALIDPSDARPLRPLVPEPRREPD